MDTKNNQSGIKPHECGQHEPEINWEAEAAELRAPLVAESGNIYDDEDDYYVEVRIPYQSYKYDPADYDDGKNKYFHCACRGCGWEGSSKYLGVFRYHDDGDVYCTYCNSMDIDTEANIPPEQQP